MSSLKAFEAYAKALRELSVENNIDINQIISELQLVLSYFDDEFESFLKNPRISKENKKEVFKQAFTNLNKYVFSTLLLLIDKDMITDLNCIIFELKQILEKENNIVHIYVETPKELSEEEELKIKNYFTLKLKKNIIITQIEDEKLVGGLIINYEGKTIDGSLLTKQESLKEYLKK